MQIGGHMFQGKALQGGWERGQSPIHVPVIYTEIFVRRRRGEVLSCLYYTTLCGD